MADYFLGIDIGGTHIKWGILDRDQNFLNKDTMDTSDSFDGNTLWKERIIDLVNSKNEEFKMRGHRLHYGISAPGLTDENNRMILHMPERLRGIEQLNWTEECDHEISVLNDGHAATLAEYETYYKSKGVKHLLLLTLGTGVGGGLIIDSKLYQGHRQRAGHVGHSTVDVNGPPTMTNMPGSLEYAIGNFSIKERTKGKFSTTKELVEAYSDGDDEAVGYWNDSLEKLAVALAGFVNILSPEIIVLGGGIAAGAENMLLEPLQRHLDQFEWRPDGRKVNIQLAKLGTHAGALGAALFAKKQLNI